MPTRLRIGRFRHLPPYVAASFAAPRCPMCASRADTRWCRRGVTLIELILTLALAVVLMSLVGTAFTFYATKLDTRDTELRRVQLAHAILDMMADDLRASLYPPEFDDAALSAMLSGSAPPSGAGEDLSAAGLDDLSGAGTSSSTLSDEPTVETADLAAGTSTTSRPGLIGNQTQIQFDVSRLPRIEEYQTMMASAMAAGNATGQKVDIPSDIKTVTYYLQPNGGGVTDPLDAVAAGGATAGSTAAAQLGSASNGGLVRRSLDRAITKWSQENGATISLLSSGDLLATEVVGLEFRYWDGMQWQIYWDSDEMGTLPMAIQVNLTMLEAGATAAESGATGVAPATREYQQVIRLPAGRPVETTSDLSAAGL